MAKVEINMPRFGAQMKEGKILKWLVNVGDVVEEDDALLEVKAEKMDAEVESLYDGKIVEIIAKEGEVYPVGAVLGYIEAEDE
ncbi:MAG: acetyl-CoA carboxylase biotin carboxyl carrier protein subunit [Eubacterium sp.]|nr:acetyl-CoA carboxylase biotin carboxyl carrier protein subunit [Eubacterium sp.]